MNEIEQRLDSIRNLIRDHHLDAWVETGSDPHGSEYVAPRWRSREWLSGFTGSAGTIVVTQEQALLWVDSRYHIQGAQQTAGSPYNLMRLGEPEVVDHVAYLADTLAVGARVGMVRHTLSMATAVALERAFVPKGIALIPTDDWYDEVWDQRPTAPSEPVVAQDMVIAGTTVGAKIGKIRKVLDSLGCTHTIVSSLDDIAWILNLRGSDIAYNPVFLAYLVISGSEVVLFTDGSRLDPQWEESFGALGKVEAYHKVFEYVGDMLRKHDVVYLSPEKSSMTLRRAIPEGIKVVEGRDVSTDLKARKSPIEIEGMRRAHLLDGIAMVKLLADLSRGSVGYDELSIAKKLANYRGEHEEYLGPSFSPIAGYGPHGALAHYSASEESFSKLVGNGLLVLDTGGQYKTGTTDITRTLLFGEPTEQMKRDYTLVLKGNLALAAQRFPVGTCGYQLDVLARQYLWQSGLSYGHGTGHGVGFCLNVHEGPANISPKTIAVALDVGMVLSDEPGIYREGNYGIRLENLIVVQSAGATEFGEFHAFDVLTLCPFERKLIERELLSDTERQMPDAYHGWVYSALSDKLSEEDAKWLREATLPL